MKTLTTEEAAAVLGLTPDTVRHYLHRGTLVGTKRGRDWFISEAEIARYQRDRKKAGRPLDPRQ